jgi:hypothetical protein
VCDGARPPFKQFAPTVQRPGPPDCTRTAKGRFLCGSEGKQRHAKELTLNLREARKAWGLKLGPTSVTS